MQIKLSLRIQPPSLVVEYDEELYGRVKNTLDKLGLEQSLINNGWGRGIQLKAYRSTGAELLQYIRSTSTITIPFVDDINKPLYMDGTFNVALFRVVPDRIDGKYIVTVPLQSLLTRWEFLTLRDAVASVFRSILGIMTDDIECNIKFRER